MTTFQDSYKNLNKAQKETVDTIEGPVMVVAGPGTGKTTILTLRIANILLKTDTAPENILALTFTNSGVHRMREKLIEYIGDEAYRVNIFTFHAFAESVLKEFSFYFPEFEYSKPISDLDKIQILEEIIKNGDFEEIISDYDMFSSLNNVKKAIDDIKKEGFDPEDFKKTLPDWEKELREDDNLFYKRKYRKFEVGDIKPSEEAKLIKKLAKAKEIHQVFEKYQEKIKEKNFYDFNDMIISVLNELEANENLKADLQERYQYILVDEHQDTNDGQNKIIELLTDAKHLDGHPNLFTVGDEKQSIYRFQGASDEAFKHFNKIYNDVKVINLEDNYRSTSDILDSSHSLINHSVENSQKLKAFNKEKEKIKVAEFSSYKFELLYVVEEIEKKIKEGIDPSEIAIIYRSNKDVEDIKNIFNYKTIPYSVYSKDDILRDKDINNLINLLRVVDNPNDSHSLGKSLFINFLNFDSYEITNLLQEFQKQNRDKKVNLFELLKDEKFDDFIKMIKELVTEQANLPFDAFFKKFIEKTGYLKYALNAKDSQDKLIRIDKIFDEIKRQNQTYKDYSLRDFIKFIDSYNKYNLDIKANDPEIINGVKLMTAHKSKGLEFEYVYIINAVRSSWEKSRGIGQIALPIKNYKGGDDDERRLFYVSMTRAKKGLMISHSKTDWEGKEKEKTQFITEIDSTFLENVKTEDFEKDNLENLHLFIQGSEKLKSIWDKEYLKELFLNTNLSVTSLNNYLSCPIKYLFRSLIKLPSEYSSFLLYGDLIHKSLEKFFKDSKREEKLLEKETLIKYFEDAINASGIHSDDYKKYLKRGKKSLSDYYDQYFETWFTDIKVEERFQREFKLENDQIITISGILDKIEYLDSPLEGKINLIDYKTGKPYSDKKRKEQKEDLKRQIIFYHLLLDGYKDNAFKIEKAVLDFVEKNSKGEFEQYIVEASKEDLDLLRENINNMAEEIMTGEFLSKGCGKKDCEYCAFVA